MTDDERAAFERTFRQHYAELCDFAASHVGSADEAEEVVQDVFFAVWLRRADLKSRGSMGPDLFGAVRNHALQHSRNVTDVRRDRISEGDETARRDWSVDKAYSEVDAKIQDWNRKFDITPPVGAFTAPWAHWRGIVLAAAILLAAALALTIARQ